MPSLPGRFPARLAQCMLLAGCALPEVNASKPADAGTQSSRHAVNQAGSDTDSTMKTEGATPAANDTCITMPCAPGAPDPTAVTTGGRCSKDGMIACSGHASVQRLICKAGAWIDSEPCSADSRCDTADMAGSCRPVAIECADAQPNSQVCSAGNLRQCDADLLSSTLVATCSGLTPLCLAGACTCAEPCSDGCVDLSQDAKNCGACGNACSKGPCVHGACQGEPQTIATGTVVIRQIAVAKGTVYFSDSNTPAGSSRQSRLLEVSRDGGTAMTIASMETSLAGWEFTLYEGNLYWCNDSVLTSMPSAGGATSTVSQSTCLEPPLAADGYLYYRGAVAAGQEGLLKQPIGGGAPTMLDSGLGSGAINAKSFFWASGSTLKAFDHRDGTAKTLTQGTAFTSLAADDAAVYGSSPDGLWKVAADGGTPVRLTDVSASELAVDAEHVYFVANKGIGRVPIAGGDSEWLVTDDGPWTSLVLDDDSAYWANNLVPPTLKRLAK